MHRMKNNVEIRNKKTVCLPAKEPSPLGSITGLGDEETDGVGSDLLVAGVDPDVAPLVLPDVSGQTCHPLTTSVR